jgi:hypothetical protein
MKTLIQLNFTFNKAQKEMNVVMSNTLVLRSDACVGKKIRNLIIIYAYN